MAVRVNIDTSDLVAWGRRQQDMPDKIRAAAARSLNYVGGKVVEEMVGRISIQSGLAVSTIRRKFSVSRATQSNLRFEVRASQELLQERSHRPMPERQFSRRPDDFFRPEELVNIVTMGDDKVCPLCEALAEGNPYTIEEARAQIPHHPNCRCSVEPASTVREEVPVEFRSRAQGGLVQTADITMGELVERLSEELRVILKAT